MCRLRNIALWVWQTDRQTDRRTDGQTMDKVIPMCRHASQATQKGEYICCSRNWTEFTPWGNLVNFTCRNLLVIKKISCIFWFLLTDLPCYHAVGNIANFYLQKVICDHEIGNIFCACQDAESMNFFAYITRDNQTAKHYCHVFNVRNPVCVTVAV